MIITQEALARLNDQRLKAGREMLNKDYAERLADKRRDGVLATTGRDARSDDLWEWLVNFKLPNDRS